MAVTNFKSPYTRQFALWVLRAISPELARSLFVHNRFYANKEIAAFLGLPKEFNEDTLADVFRQLDTTLIALEGTSRPIRLPKRVSDNLTEFTRIFHLTRPRPRSCAISLAAKSNPSSSICNS